MTKRAVIYGRVSVDKGGRSVDDQLAECRRFVAGQGWSVAAEFTDRGKGASRVSKGTRSGWASVKAAIARGEADVLCTWEASRRERDTTEFSLLRDLCRDHGVLLAYSGRVLDLTDSGDNFVAGLDALLAEKEAGAIRERVLRTTRAQAERGAVHGRRLYGFRRVRHPDTGRPLGQEADPEEAPIVREIVHRLAHGESAYSIAEDLNRRGVPQTSGAPWQISRIKRIATNPAYIGVRIHLGVEHPATWESIVDVEEWKTVRAMYADPERDKYRARRDPAHLLSGVARCGLCGSPMYVGGDRGRPIYICRAGKGHLTRSKENLDAFVTGCVVERLKTFDFGSIESAGDDPNLMAAQAHLDRLRRQLEEAVEEWKAGRLTTKLLGRLEADLEPQVAEAERQIIQFRTPPELRIAAIDGDADWEQLGLAQQKAIIAAVVRVVVMPAPTADRGKKTFDPNLIRLEWIV